MFNQQNAQRLTLIRWTHFSYRISRYDTNSYFILSLLCMSYLIFSELKNGINPRLFNVITENLIFISIIILFFVAIKIFIQKREDIRYRIIFISSFLNLGFLILVLGGDKSKDISFFYLIIGFFFFIKPIYEWLKYRGTICCLVLAPDTWDREYNRRFIDKFIESVNVHYSEVTVLKPRRKLKKTDLFFPSSIKLLLGEQKTIVYILKRLFSPYIVQIRLKNKPSDREIELQLKQIITDLIEKIHSEMTREQIQS